MILSHLWGLKDEKRSCHIFNNSNAINFTFDACVWDKCKNARLGLPVNVTITINNHFFYLCRDLSKTIAKKRKNSESILTWKKWTQRRMKKSPWIQAQEKLSWRRNCPTWPKSTKNWRKTWWVQDFFWISLRFNYMSCLMKFVTRHATWSFKTSLFHSLIFGGKNVNYPHTINKKVFSPLPLGWYMMKQSVQPL